VSDPFSSANGALEHPTDGAPWAAPASWLLRVGWRRARGSVDVDAELLEALARARVAVVVRQ